MKIFTCIFFIALNFALIFIVTKDMERKQAVTIFGASLLVVPALAVLTMLVLKVIGFQPEPDFKDLFFNIFMSLMVLVLMNLIILLADYMMDLLIGFHQQHNASNADQFPPRFAIKNRDSIMVFYRRLFFLGSFLLFYGIWFDKK